MTVLVRIEGDYPVWPAFYDGECWRSCSADPLYGPVFGWMNFEDAAEVLDQKEGTQ